MSASSWKIVNIRVAGTFVSLFAFTGIVPILQAQQVEAAGLPSAPAVSVQHFEIGIQYAFLGKGVCYKTNCNIPPEVALGTEVSWNATPHLAVDAAYNELVTTERFYRAFQDGSFAGGRGATVAAGPRLEVRRPHYGLFVYGQMGTEIWTKAPVPYVYNADHQLVTFASAQGLRAFFSVAAGVGAEYSPSNRWHFRVATGERVVDYGRAYQGTPCGACAAPATAWDAGDDLTAGVYMGVGPSFKKQLYREEAHPHAFFDKWNNLLITGAVLASIGDGVTTQLFLDKGIPEGNPIERTFTQRGVGGDIGLGAIAGAAGIGAMYALHRMGHHWIERALPAAILILEARDTYLNSKID